MQALLASLVFSMSVKDDAYKAGMAAARAEAKKTGQDMDRSADQMGSAVRRAALQVNEAAIRISDSVAKIGRDVQNAGLKLTAGLTLPLGLLAHTAKDTASDFEAGMNRVHAAMVGASPEELERLKQAALTLGPAFGKSAIEAAESIESLAKNGLDTASILSGGLAASLKLGVVGQTDLGSAADATTDILQQFHLSTGQLPAVVDKVSGALDASKLSFDGYKDAIGQVGGIAGGLGYTFDDMNTALAAVIPLMTGGSDAGTSFKTFLLSLVPQSKDAADVMKQLGIEFFDSTGKAKSLSEVAEVLNTRLAGLNDRSRQQALTKMFGTDGMRVALALMQAGAKGIADVQAQVDKASADQKMAILLDGEAAATQRVASAWERLKINIGEAGIIQAYTGVKEALAGVLGVLGSAPPWFYKTAVAVGALTAATGPLMLAGLGIAKVMLPLLLLRLGPVALGFAALINPVGVVVRLLGMLALQAGAATLLGRLGTTLIAIAGPIGLFATALALLIPRIQAMSQVSQAYADAQARLNEDQQRGRDITMQLATATGKARQEALSAAQALRVQRVEALATAKAMLIAARANYAKQRDLETSGASSTGVGALLGLITGRNRTGAARDLVAANEVYRQRMADLSSLDTAIANAGKAPAPTRNVDFDKEKKKRTRKGRDTSADDEDYDARLAEVRNANLQAQAELTGGIDARYRADMDALDADRASYAKQLATDQRLTDAKRATLMAAKDEETATRRAIVEQNRTIAKAQEGYDLARADNEAAQDRARIESDFADSAMARRDAELRLLDLQRKQEEADLDLILATKASSSAEWANASKRKDALPGKYAGLKAQIDRNTEGPAASYMRTINMSAGARSEQMEALGVDALRDLNTGLTDAIMNSAKLGDAFVNMGKRIIASLLDIAIQQAVIRPLANSLFGQADEKGNRSGGALLKLGASVAKAFGGGRAKGGGISASEWYVVGEKGPELFAPGVSGTIIPNGGRGSRARGGAPAVIQLVMDEGAMFAPRVQGISGQVSVQTVRSAGRSNAVQARQTVR